MFLSPRPPRARTVTVWLGLLAATQLAVAGSPAALRAVAQAVPPALGAASVQWICSQAGRGGDCPSGFGGPPQLDPARFDCGFCTAGAAVARAYGVSVQQVQGGPPWFNSDRYRIQVVSSSATDAGGMMRLLQWVLARSFGLNARLVTKVVPVYALVSGRDTKGIRRLPGAASDAPPTRFDGASAHFFTLQELVDYLNSLYYGHTGGVDRPVVDHTGLLGRYDIVLDLSRVMTGGGPVPVLSVVREQLGLGVQNAVGTARFVKVDRIRHLRGDWSGG